MQTEYKRVTVGDLVKGYRDRGAEGVVGYSGRLDIRPPYQREFIYNAQQQVKVVQSVMQGFPLGQMHWARQASSFEIIDGQQRTISLARYVQGDFSVDDKYFHNLTRQEQERLYRYELAVYLFKGTDRQRLDWFERVNTAGEALNDQEIRNATYPGPWVQDARRYFSKRGCPAYRLGSLLLKGSPIRQDYLEAALRWISDDRIVDYMAQHQHDADAEPLWAYFQDVIHWTKKTFRVWRKPMKGLDWGLLYNEHKDTVLDPDAIEAEIQALFVDEEVQRPVGIYPYVLTRDEQHLRLRLFPDHMKQWAYERQHGRCGACAEAFVLADLEAHHITPWSEGGKTEEENCLLLCRPCHRAIGSGSIKIPDRVFTTKEEILALGHAIQDW